MKAPSGGKPYQGNGGLCPQVDLRVIMLVGMLTLCTRTFLLTWDMDLSALDEESQPNEQLDLERIELERERAERQAKREQTFEKKRKEEEGLLKARQARANGRAVRKREQKEEEMRLVKDMERETKARKEEEGGSGALLVHSTGDVLLEDEDGDLDTQDAVRKRHQQEPRPTEDGVGGEYRSPDGWTDEAPRACDTWKEGPFGGKAQASITKAVWIQNHGNNTASQWKRQNEGVTNGKWKIHQGLRYHHTVSLARLASGSVFAAWQAAEDTEGESDQHIRMSVSRDGAKGWKQSWRLNVTRFGGALWSPVPHVDASGRLHLFYTESEGDCRRRSKPKSKWPPGGSIKMAVCLDQEPDPNSAWTEPRTIYGIEEDGWIPKMLSNKLVVLSSGEWVLPFWRENAMLAKGTWPDKQAHCRVKDAVKDGQKATNHAVPYASGLFSQDGGRTWESRGKLHDAAYPDADGWALDTKTTWLIENSVVELSNGDLKMFFRTHAGFIYQAQSSDKGITWTEPVPTSIQNPDSKSQVVRLKPSGPLLMVFNDHKRGIIRSNHTDVKLPNKCVTLLSLAISEDDGNSWRRIGVLRGGVAPGLRFHYPWILQMGCKVLVAYSKFYVTGFKYQENDRELGLRAVHVHL